MFKISIRAQQNDIKTSRSWTLFFSEFLLSWVIYILSSCIKYGLCSSSDRAQRSGCGDISWSRTVGSAVEIDTRMYACSRDWGSRLSNFSSALRCSTVLKLYKQNLSLMVFKQGGLFEAQQHSGRVLLSVNSEHWLPSSCCSSVLKVSVIELCISILVVS